ncbi:TetR/AcrR family transcriptional regulator [Pseudonocardia sp. TRM90224]|uniref:TetR/AcrR family transcriptional regulator n=1 Tax=Pseudonocardia sp. TRM90224 TaxID=2812678 RepID=UPI001E640822|nr:TetR/AcrR family transcriptional regulator [Pseudonocardia sp. TRM90224]
MSPAEPTSASERTRASLTADRILDVALKVTDADGGAALTFKRLGRELGAAPTAVLRHFRDKDDLLLAMGDRLYAEASASIGTADGSWRERLTRLAHATRDAFVAHPRVALLVATRTMRRPSEFHGADVIIGAMLEAGLDRRSAASLYRVFVDTVLAWAAFQAATRTIDPALMERDEESWAREYVMLPAARYPSINAVAPLLAEVTKEDQFVLTVELLLDAIEARAATQVDRPPSGTPRSAGG